MKIIFIHPNFPAQFRHVATQLGKDADNEVVFVCSNPKPEWKIPGVRKEVYKVSRPGKLEGFPAREFALKLAEARAVLELLSRLKKSGFAPDIIIGHSGWGATFFVRDLFPETPFLAYFEWYYNLRGSSLDFDPAQQPTLNTALNIRLRNTYILNDLEACSRGIAPTAWQLNQFPESYRPKIVQLHEGINTGFFKPLEGKGLKLPELDLTGVKKIVTYTARGMEPYRGFPQFMEALPIVLQQDKECHVVIAGSDRVCYGKALPDGKTYREHMLAKLDLDMERVHFVGQLPYGDYLKVLQSATVHVYLSVPFVLSWSLLEAMACGCTVVASDTQPVREVIEDGVNGILADFFSSEDIAAKIIGTLAYPSMTAQLGTAARKTRTCR